MRNYEYDSEKYLLPVKLHIDRPLSTLTVVILCWISLFSITFVVLEITNLIASLCVLALGIIAITVFFHLFIPSYLIIDEEKIQLSSLLFYKKTIYLADIEDLNVWIKDVLSKYNRPSGEKKVVLSYSKSNGKKDEISFGVRTKSKMNLEKINQTIWYAYHRYHPEYPNDI